MKQASTRLQFCNVIWLKTGFDTNQNRQLMCDLHRRGMWNWWQVRCIQFIEHTHAYYIRLMQQFFRKFLLSLSLWLHQITISLNKLQTLLAKSIVYQMVGHRWCFTLRTRPSEKRRSQRLPLHVAMFPMLSLRSNWPRKLMVFPTNTMNLFASKATI